MLTQIKLVDGAYEMLLRPRTGVAHSSLEKGYPTVREVTTDRTDDDGTTDTTDKHGAAAVSLKLVLYQHGTTRAIIDELSSFSSPSQRPYLYVSDDEWTQDRRIMLRPDQFSQPIEAGRGALRDVQASWKAPTGLWEAVTETTVSILADTGASGGRTYPRTYPRTYTATTSTSRAEVINPGTVPCHWIARFYGPCTAPALRNELTGQRLQFAPTLVLGAGEYVEVDSAERTALFESDPDQDRVGDIQFESNSWWKLGHRGVQTIRYVPSSASPGAKAEFRFRPKWLM